MTYWIEPDPLPIKGLERGPHEILDGNRVPSIIILGNRDLQWDKKPLRRLRNDDLMTFYMGSDP